MEADVGTTRRQAQLEGVAGTSAVGEEDGARPIAELQRATGAGAELPCRRGWLCEVAGTSAVGEEDGA